MESCETESMFSNMLENAEEKDKNQNMPVRMFYRNTFQDIINTAMFELKKKQRKYPNDTELFTKEGSVKFVAFYILEFLPDGERKAVMDSDSD